MLDCEIFLFYFCFFSNSHTTTKTISMPHKIKFVAWFAFDWFLNAVVVVWCSSFLFILSTLPFFTYWFAAAAVVVIDAFGTTAIILQQIALHCTFCFLHPRQHQQETNYFSIYTVTYGTDWIRTFYDYIISLKIMKSLFTGKINTTQCIFHPNRIDFCLRRKSIHPFNLYFITEFMCDF